MKNSFGGFYRKSNLCFSEEFHRLLSNFLNLSLALALAEVL